MAGTVMPAHQGGLVACFCPLLAVLFHVPIPGVVARGGCAVCRSQSVTACSRHGVGATSRGHLSAGAGRHISYDPSHPTQAPEPPSLPRGLPKGP